MSPILRERLTRYYVDYYRDTLGLPDWSARVTARLTEEETDAGRVERIEVALGSLAGRSLLNVGCGTGGFNVAAARAGVRSVGVDASVEAVAICELKRALGSGGCYAAAEAEHLPFRGASFDLLACISTVEHVRDVGAALREMVRVLRPGGTLFVYAPSGWALHEKHYKLRWLPLVPAATGQSLSAAARPADGLRGDAESAERASVPAGTRAGPAPLLRKCRCRRRDRALMASRARWSAGYSRVFKPYIALLARKPLA